jgi:hypothetical protein
MVRLSPNLLLDPPSYNASTCGSGGCVFDVWAKENGEWRVVLEDIAFAVAATSKANISFQDIVVGSKSLVLVYQYDGSKYAPIMCYDANAAEKWQSMTPRKCNFSL